MKRKEIEEYRQKLVEIQMMPKEEGRKGVLHELAKEVGASTEHTKIVGTSTQKSGNVTETTIHQNPISESDLVQNINHALQTASMIDMCKIANRNFVIALIATLIALGSAVAAWVAACR